MVLRLTDLVQKQARAECKAVSEQGAAFGGDEKLNFMHNIEVGGARRWNMVSGTGGGGTLGGGAGEGGVGGVGR